MKHSLRHLSGPLVIVGFLVASCSSGPKVSSKNSAQAKTSRTSVEKPQRREAKSGVSTKQLESSLFSNGLETKGSLFCGYYRSSCESSNTSSHIVLLTKDKDAYRLEDFGHDAKSLDRDPETFESENIAQVPAVFASRDNGSQKTLLYTTCNASLKPKDFCSLTLSAASNGEVLFRGLCSPRGVREFYQPCAGERMGSPGTVRQSKLTYGKKTFDLPLLSASQDLSTWDKPIPAEDFERLKSALVRQRMGTVPAWINLGTWDEWIDTLPTHWNKSEVSIVAVTLPPTSLGFLLLEPAGHFEDLTILDVEQAPVGATAVVDGRDCDQPDMKLGFVLPGNAGFNRTVDGLFIDKSTSRFVWKRGLKAFCR